MRATLNLDTKDEGTYITDFAFGIIDNMVKYCETNGYTTKNLYIIIQEINKVEIMIKDILQYYHYFIRPDFRQKPDIDMATERYKTMADERTVDELKAIVGKRHKVDFSSLGQNKIQLPSEESPEELEYQDEVDEEVDDEFRDMGGPEGRAV
jgi:hypothetical protein